MRFVLLIGALAAFTVSAHARSTENALSVTELRAGCEAALAMSKGEAVSEGQQRAGLRVLAYLDGYVEALTVTQYANPSLRLIHIPEEGRLRIAYVQAVHAFILNNPQFEKDGTARLVVMLALKQNYSP